MFVFTDLSSLRLLNVGKKKLKLKKKILLITKRYTVHVAEVC